MDPDMIFPVVLTILVFIGFLYAIGTFINRRKQMKNYNPEELPPPDLIVHKAEIIHKYVDTQRTGGYKSPSHRLVYRVVFKLENGETKEFSVPQENFEGCKLHDVGNLIIAGDDFFDFGDGEDIYDENEI